MTNRLLAIRNRHVRVLLALDRGEAPKAIAEREGISHQLVSKIKLQSKMARDRKAAA